MVPTAAFLARAAKGLEMAEGKRASEPRLAKPFWAAPQSVGDPSFWHQVEWALGGGTCFSPPWLTPQVVWHRTCSHLGIDPPELVAGAGARLLLPDGENPMRLRPDEPQGAWHRCSKDSQGGLGAWKAPGYLRSCFLLDSFFSI